MLNKKIVSVFALILCMTMLLTACGGQGGNASADAEYRVTVSDAMGTPYTTGIIVAFLQNGQQVAMQNVDATGVAVKTLPRGEYTVELMFTGDENEFFFDKTQDLSLTGEKTELTVVLAKALTGEANTISVNGQAKDAWYVTTGCTKVTLTGERDYFLFAPTEAGTYEFSTDNASAAIGYYGAPHFVQTASAAEVVDNKFTISVKASMIGTDGTGTTILVIGIDGPGLDSATLNIQRTGDPQWDVSDEPWMIYTPTVELAPYTLPAGATLAEFDLTAASDAYNLVLGADGFYHLDSAEGPLVLVRLGEKSKYLDPYKTITEKTGVNRYFFDENGEFIKKENYTDCILQYLEVMDEDSGTYPLTEDLKYIIQNHGIQNGWYDRDGHSYLFVDQNRDPVPGINADISWLFMCCYIA